MTPEILLDLTKCSEMIQPTCIYNHSKKQVTGSDGTTYPAEGFSEADDGKEVVEGKDFRIVFRDPDRMDSNDCMPIAIPAEPVVKEVKYIEYDFNDRNAIAFGIHLIGHSRKDIEQLYNDFKSKQ